MSMCIKRDFCDCEYSVVEKAYVEQQIYWTYYLFIYVFIKPEIKT